MQEDDEISVDDSSDESFGEFTGNIVIVKKENVNKDAPLTAANQRDRQPLLKKSPTDKVFDLLSSTVGGKSESKLAHYVSSVNCILRNKLSGNVYNKDNIFPTHPVMRRGCIFYR